MRATLSQGLLSREPAAWAAMVAHMLVAPASLNHTPSQNFGSMYHSDALSRCPLWHCRYLGARPAALHAAGQGAAKEGAPGAQQCCYES